MAQNFPIRLGSRVYLRVAVAGDPGVVVGFDRAGNARVQWDDLPELGRWTTHSVDSLVVDESFTVSQLGLFSNEEVAA